MLSPGSRLGHFTVVSTLGAGGMGEVYRARDERLGREVAIKVLPAVFAADPERLRRFEQEARATAALDHPNILAIYDVGAQEGAPYLVEQLLEGSSLRERLRDGALPCGEAVEIAAQIAHGLAAAHGKGILHRDLKPDNVFITPGGVVKILDFGLAKLAIEQDDTDLTAAPTEAPPTAAGVILGTAGYMAPEQVRGRPCDQRSDIFALGCVLYEMLSGKRAFHGETAADTASSILTKDPPLLAGSGSDIPPALQGIVSRCLEKRPEDRFSSAHDLALALRAVSGGPGAHTGAVVTVLSGKRRTVGLVLVGVALLATTVALVLKLKPVGPTAGAAARKMIVVLPFENLGAPEDAYFAAGMAEEIISRLANVQGLGVISRTTAVEYNRKGKTVKQIGADLGVDYVLEGTVRWEHGPGNESRVRITPQLIRVADDTHVWADRYDRVLADVFAIQSEVAASAVEAMGVTLLPREQTALKEISTNDLVAYDLYLRGLAALGQGSTCEFFASAVEKFQAAVDRDPRFAQAIAITASMHLALAWMHCGHVQEHLAKGKEAAERAIELRPDLAVSHLALGDYFYRGLQDLPRALAEYAIALKIQPSNAWALLDTGFVLRFQGHWVEAAAAFEKGVELDPRNSHLVHHLGTCYRLAGHFADADRAFARAIALSPQWSWPYAFQARLQVEWHGDVAKAQAILDEARRVTGINEEFLGPRRWLALLRRDYPEALRLLEEAERQAGDDPGEHVRLSLLRGQVEMLAGEPVVARRAFDAASVALEKKVAQAPDNADLHTSLAISYAGLGRSADAVREVRHGLDLALASEDRSRPTDRLEDLARVYTMVGRPSEAIATLDELMSRRGDYTTHLLRLEPTWDPLRSDPRFQALLAKYEVKP